MPEPYLLDTNLLLVYARGNGPVFEAVETTYELSKPQTAASVSIVSIAEVLVLANRRSWGAKKREALDALVSKLVCIDIRNDRALLEAYVDIDTYSLGLKSAVVMGKNDLWIAATAKVTKSILLTTDGDFDHLEKTHITRHKVNAKTGAITKS